MKRKLILTVMLAGQILLVFGAWFFLYLPVSAMQSVWQTEHQLYLNKQQHLTILSESMGYGGLIHHFKNFVIRREINYFEQAETSAEEARVAIEQLQLLLTNETERQLLDRIHNVRQAYQASLHWMDANQATLPSLTVTELDRQVRVDDSSAFKALDELDLRIQQQFDQVSKHTEQIEARFETQLISLMMFITLVYWGALLVINSFYHSFRRNFQQLKAIYRLSPLAMILINDRGQIVQANQAFKSMFAVPETLSLNKATIETFVPKRYRKIHQSHRKEFQQSKNSVAMEDRSKDFKALALNGREFPIEIAISSMKDQGMSHSLAIIKDKTVELQLKERADFDYLTHIHNRRFAESQLENEMIRFKRYGEVFSILLIDIDHFKAVNDNLGHEAGDKVLLKVVGLLERNLRESDLLGRWGGDEFIAILPYTDNKTGQLIACKLVELVEQAFANEKVKTTLSIGLTTIDQLKDAREVLMDADQALYLAKTSGRNCMR